MLTWCLPVDYGLLGVIIPNREQQLGRIPLAAFQAMHEQSRRLLCLITKIGKLQLYSIRSFEWEPSDPDLS